MLTAKVQWLNLTHNNLSFRKVFLSLIAIRADVNEVDGRVKENGVLAFYRIRGLLPSRGKNLNIR